MNRRQMKRLQIGDIVHQKLAPQHGLRQDMGNLCVVLEISARGGVMLADTLTNERYWSPYQRLYLYPATDEHKGLLWRRVGLPLP